MTKNQEMKIDSLIDALPNWLICIKRKNNNTTPLIMTTRRKRGGYFMKQGKKVIALAILIVLVAMMFAGCRGDSGLVGTWERSMFNLELSRDGSGRVFGDNVQTAQITWEAIDNTLIIRIRDGYPLSGTFELVDSSLVIQNIGSTFDGTWTRQ